MLDIKDIVQTFQFTTTLKGVIRLGNVSTVFTWNDGIKAKFSQNSVKALRKAYNNVINYEPGNIALGMKMIGLFSVIRNESYKSGIYGNMNLDDLLR